MQNTHFNFFFFFLVIDIELIKTATSCLAF